MMQIETPLGLAELEKQAAVEAYFEACFFVVALSDAHLAVAHITDKQGRVVIATNERRTVTQATCNGGSVERLNAYINFSDFKIRQA